MVQSEKNNFEIDVWTLGFTLFLAVKNHKVAGTRSSTEKEWMRLYLRLYIYPFHLHVYLLSLVGIIVFINLIDSALVTLKMFYGKKTPSANTGDIFLDIHNN